VKRLISSLFAILLFTASVFAQVGFGIKGGVNFASIGGADADPGTGSLTGFAAGGYLDLNFPYLPRLQLEALYSTKGSTSTQDFAAFGIQSVAKRTRSLAYLDIPVLIQIPFPTQAFKSNLYIGPDIGFLLDSKVKSQITGQPATTTDTRAMTTSTDYGLIGGANVHLYFVNVDIRYDLGFRTLDGYGTLIMYNQVWSIMVELPLY